MIARIGYDMIGIVLLFILPWWGILLYGIGGIVLFPRYVEIAFFGVFFDITYGGSFLPWYLRYEHTILFGSIGIFGLWLRDRVKIF